MVSHRHSSDVVPSPIADGVKARTVERCPARQFRRSDWFMQILDHLYNNATTLDELVEHVRVWTRMKALAEVYVVSPNKFGDGTRRTVEPHEHLAGPVHRH